MQQRLPSLIGRPIAFGHRGARAHERENTLPSFALARRLGASGLESDVWLTSDGVPVLDHDGVVKGRLGRTRRIGELTRSALPAHIPTLAELYDTCGADLVLSLDLKAPGCGPRVVDVVTEVAPDALEDLWLCAPRWQDLLDLRGRGVKLVESTSVRAMKEGPERRAATLRQQGIHCMNMHHTEWNGGMVALFHRFERYCFGWDMQDPHVIEAGLRMGLDGIYSDWVDRMMECYRAQIDGLSPPGAG